MVLKKEYAVYFPIRYKMQKETTTADEQRPNHFATGINTTPMKNRFYTLAQLLIISFIFPSLLKAQCTLSIEGDSGICPGGTAYLIATVMGPEPYYDINWFFQGDIIATGTDELIVFEPGEYIAAITTTNGCTDSTSFIVAPYPSPNLSISGPNCFAPGDSMAVLTAEGDFAFISWSTGYIGENLTVYEPGTYCGTAYDSSGICSTEMCFTLYPANQLNIVALDAFCPDSLASCQQVCAHSLVTYEVQGLYDTSAQVIWTVSGAEDYQINGQQISVLWGEAGQGFLSVSDENNYPNENLPLQAFPGQYLNPLDSSLVVFVFVTGGLPPYTVEAVLPFSLPFYPTSFSEENGGVLFLFEDVNPGDPLQISVTDANDQTLTESVMVFDPDQAGGGGSANCLPPPFYPYIIHPPDCGQCNASVGFAGPLGLNVSPTYSISSDIIQSNLSPPLPAQENLCEGTHLFSIIAETDPFCAQPMTIELSCGLPSNCSSEDQLCVNILPEPQAHFTSQPEALNDTLTLCLGQTASFLNESEGATSYIWNFGDGQLSATYTPEHTYFNEGTYTLSLIARNNCYCSDTTFLTVKVLDALIPNITCTGTVCQGETVTYSTTANCSNYSWNISPEGTILSGGGPSDPFVEVQWLQGEEGYVELSTPACSGATCALPNRVHIPILSDEAEIQGATEVCYQSIEEYSITEFGSGTSFSWSVSGGGVLLDGQGTHRITVLWEDQANILGNPQWVAVEYENCYLDCGGQDTLNISILPEFYISGPIAVCQYSENFFTAQNSLNNAPVSCYWKLLNANDELVWSSPSTTFSPLIGFDLPAGLYTLLAEAANPSMLCQDSYRTFIQVEAAPPPLSGIAGTTEICPGTSYLYQAQGLLAGHAVVWTIQNGNQTQEFTGESVVVNWGDTPPYVLTAVQTGPTALQCASDPVQLIAQPIPAFSITGPSQACPEDILSFSIPAFENLSPQWSIDNEELAILLNGQGTEQVSIQALQAGTITLSVSVCGLSANVQLEIHDFPMPTVLTPPGLCPGETAVVQTSETYDTYSWYDENGNLLSTNATADLTAGIYQLEVFDGFCSGNTTFSITSYPQPYAHIAVPLYGGLCTGSSVNLHATQTEQGYSFQWYLNGNPIPGATSSVLTTDEIGLYGLEVSNAFGCTTSAPEIQLSACEDVGGICVNGICTPSGSGPPGPGCAFDEAPSYELNSTADCNTHQFTNTTQTHQPGSMSWFFFDTNSLLFQTSSDENPLVNFPPVLGFYPIIQSANMPNLADPGTFCEVSTLSQDTIKIVPDFIVEANCLENPIQFTAHSQILAGSNITGYSWYFDDPTSGPDNTSTLENPSHLFSAPGTYQVNMTVFEASGCQVNITKPVEVLPPPEVDFSLPDQNCEDLAVQFLPQGIGDDITSYLWNFGDPDSGDNNSSDFESPFHTFTQSGSYDVSLTVTDIYGCSNTQTHTFQVMANQLSGSIAVQPDTLICPGDTAYLQAPNNGPGVSFSWNTMENSQEIITAEAGIFGVSLSDVNGCTYSPDMVSIHLFDLPIANIQAIEYNEYGQPAAVFEDSYTTCEGEDIYLEVVGSTDYDYIWSTGETGEEISFTEEKDNLLPPGMYEITVDIIDANGCTAEAGPFVLLVNPAPEEPVLNTNPTPPLCEGETALISVANPNPELSYSWNTGESGTQITAIAAGNYFVRATTAEGCSTDSEPVEIHSAPPLSQVPSGCFTRCNPDTICLPPFPEGTNFQWFFEGQAIPAPQGTVPDLVATQSGTYELTLEDNYGCASTSDPLTLDLQDPIGDIYGSVWFDLNQNGQIDAADTLVPGIQLLLLLNGQEEANSSSDISGQYLFDDIAAENYLLVINPSSLPSGWSTVIDSLTASLQTCDDETSADFLVSTTCIASIEEDVILQLCPEDSILYNGQYFHPGDTATFSFLTLYECDSTVHVSAQALPAQLDSLEFFLCPYDSLLYQGQYLYPGDVLSLQYINQYGCDSTIVAQALVLPESSFETEVTDTSCWNQNSGSLLVHLQDAPAGPYTYSVDGENFQTDPLFQHLPKGEYTVWIEDANGCRFPQEAFLPGIEPLQLLTENVNLACEQPGVLLEPVLLNPSGVAVSWQWPDGSQGTSWYVEEAGDYLLVVSDVCESREALISVRYEQSADELPVYVPNAFSPNGDGLNDCFKPEFPEGVELLSYTFRVFDRWGNFLFDTSSPADCWDGSFRQKEMDPGVYVWYLEASFKYCHQPSEIFKKGDVVLVK